MKSWNDGIVGVQRKLSILSFDVEMNFAMNAIWQYLKTHFSNISFFHYSNRGEAPNV
jgi:hypothetical protein